MTDGRMFAAIDIGTTGVCVLAAEMTDKGPLIRGAGDAPSRGLRKGIVVNIDEAAASVRAAVRAAEAASGKKIRKAIIGISGQHIAGFPSSGVIGLRGRKITPSDRMRAVDSAETVYIPLDREVLHVIPTEFILDGQRGITDPVGMSGVRLESRVYIVTAYAQAVQSLQKACEQAGLEILDMVFGPVATAGAALTDDEIWQGAVLVDIGGGTTDIAQFKDGVLVHASVLGIGGLHVTNDLAVGLKLGADEAEKIKTAAGAASSAGMQRHETTEICLPGETVRKVSMQEIVSIIQPRCEELFELVRNELTGCRLQGPAPVRVVLTGGTALLNNMADLAASVLGMPARIGLPQGVPGIKHSLKTPAYAAGVGLLAYAHQRGIQDELISDTAAGLLGKLKDRFMRLAGYRDFLEIPNKKKKGVSYV